MSNDILQSLHPLDDSDIEIADSNESKYEGIDLLSNLLNPKFYTPSLDDFINGDLTLLDEHIPSGARVGDIGCGLGRHLKHLVSRPSPISRGYGFDICRPAIQEARQINDSDRLEFYRINILRPKLLVDRERRLGEDIDRDIRSPLCTKVIEPLTHVICMFNTIGNIPHRPVVLRNMQQMLNFDGTLILTVYSDKSIDSRVEQYTKMGLGEITITDSHLKAGNFWSEHFDFERARREFPGFDILPYTEIGWLIVAQPWKVISQL